MDSQCTVLVELEIGHCAQLRKKPTKDGFNYNWMVFVRGPGKCDIQHFVDRVIFGLHDSLPKPKRVCRKPPYRVEETGNIGFMLPIEVHFKNKEEPKKVSFTYDLFLNLEGNSFVNHLRCEKLTFNNPTKEFCKKLLKGGGIGIEDGKKASTLHHVTKEHLECPRKDSKSNTKESDPKKASSPKVVDNKSPKEENASIKAAFNELKLPLIETKAENMYAKRGPTDYKLSICGNTDFHASSSKKPKISEGLPVSSTLP
ncbi:hypothetical protein GDO86_001087 [Hymenochirus boettgeri]|uniref:YEATS domain-containing protein n=1 Tax=Hymenochirus boettgeri TaxID=247094 RepID=A0A8T2KEH1_9PIPI|nr:hypothetical protein GDO86_001087 [Hymenochirus boettgeri]